MRENEENKAGLKNKGGGGEWDLKRNMRKRRELDLKRKGKWGRRKGKEMAGT